MFSMYHSLYIERNRTFLFICVDYRLVFYQDCRWTGVYPSMHWADPGQMANANTMTSWKVCPI